MSNFLEDTFGARRNCNEYVSWCKMDDWISNSLSKSLTSPEVRSHLQLISLSTPSSAPSKKLSTRTESQATRRSTQPFSRLSPSPSCLVLCLETSVTVLFCSCLVFYSASVIIRQFKHSGHTDISSSWWASSQPMLAISTMTLPLYLSSYLRHATSLSMVITSQIVFTSLVLTQCGIVQRICWHIWIRWRWNYQSSLVLRRCHLESSWKLSTLYISKNSMIFTLSSSLRSFFCGSSLDTWLYSYSWNG